MKNAEGLSTCNNNRIDAKMIKTTDFECEMRSKTNRMKIKFYNRNRLICNTFGIRAVYA